MKAATRIFRNNPTATLIAVNVGVTVLMYLYAAILTISGSKDIGLQFYLAMPAAPQMLLYEPWTPITYMFTQWDIMHLLVNMLWLWMFGRLYASVNAPRRLYQLYLLGGITGAAAFVVYFLIVGGFGGMLAGASASVLAVIAATGIQIGNMEIDLFIFGRVRLKWVAIVALVYFIAVAATMSIGASVAHLGGALLGALIALKPSIVRSKPKRSPVAERQNREFSNDDHAELDRLLAKVRKSGYASLTKSEAAKLFELSKKIK